MSQNPLNNLQCKTLILLLFFPKVTLNQLKSSCVLYLMAALRSNVVRNLLRLPQIQPQPCQSFSSSRGYSNAIITGSEALIGRKCATLFKIPDFPLPHGSTKVLRSTMGAELSVFLKEVRPATTQVKPSPQVRQMGSAQVAMVSPGIVYEPYEPRPPISFLQRWFTRSGWRRTKEDMILELKNAYAITKLRKIGYSKKAFYNEAFQIYKKINKLVAEGDKTSLRKSVTENMFSGLKNEIKRREAVWKKVHWELIEPAVKIRTLRARLIGVDRNNLNKVFIQLTLEFLTKQKFEAYDSKGNVVAGDKNKEVLVKDIWVFEKSLFHSGAYWRLCGRLSSSI